jgi:hypothetical protein
MFTLLQMLPYRRLLGEQLPALLLAWAIAEAFYKFKSFSLEMIAFLVTWFVLDAGVQGIKSLLSAPSAEARPARPPRESSKVAKPHLPENKPAPGADRGNP